MSRQGGIMPISNDRRLYLTLPSEQYKLDIEREAKARGFSMSQYVIIRLEMLQLIEADEVGAALVKSLVGKNGHLSPA